MQKVAIFGGAFNPIHWGHLLIAEAAFSQFALDQVIWVPSFHPPHKHEALLEFERRLEFVRQAIADHPAFTVSEVDARRSGVSYAVLTLYDLQSQHPNSCWFWILGLDAFLSLPKWYGNSELAAQCTWLVAPRSGNDALSLPPIYPVQNSQLPSQPEESQLEESSWSEVLCQQVARQMAERSTPLCWQLLSLPFVQVSSSLVRQYCQEGRSIRYLVPESVRQDIVAHKLYK